MPIRLFNVLIAGLFLVYPPLVYWGLLKFETRQVALVLAALLALRLLVSVKDQQLKSYGMILTGVLALNSVLAALFESQFLLKLYPVIVNISLLAMFAHSLKGEQSMVERFARIREKFLYPWAVAYTRNVTKVWCLFFVVNGLVSIATVLYFSNAVWAFYNGFLSYLLMGQLFILEYLYRRHFKKVRTLSLSAIPRRYDENSPVFIGRDDKKTNWSEFEKSVSNAVGYMRTQKGHRVLLAIQDVQDFSAGLLGAFMAGKTPVLLHNNQPGTLEKFRSEYDFICEPSSTVGVSTLDWNQVTPDKEIILFTSGSSGEPKKIVKRLFEIEAELNVQECVLGSEVRNSIITSTVSQQHIYGLLFRVLWPLVSGRVTTRQNLEFPEQLIELERKGRAFSLISSPSFLKRVQLGDQNIKSCQAIISSGGLLSDKDSAHIYETTGVSPIEILGSTETGGVATRQQKLEKLWKALPLVSVEADTVTGCLKVNSAFIQTENEVMGDLVEFSENGFFSLRGRGDRVLKVEDKRLSLTEMEQTLERHQLVEEVGLLPIQTHKTELVAILKLNEQGFSQLAEVGKSNMASEFRSYLEKFYDLVLVPRRFRFVESNLKNSQSKIELGRLQEIFDAHP